MIQTDIEMYRILICRHTDIQTFRHTDRLNHKGSPNLKKSFSELSPLRRHLIPIWRMESGQDMKIRSYKSFIRLDLILHKLFPKKDLNSLDY